MASPPPGHAVGAVHHGGDVLRELEAVSRLPAEAAQRPADRLLRRERAGLASLARHRPSSDWRAGRDHLLCVVGPGRPGPAPGLRQDPAGLDRPRAVPHLVLPVARGGCDGHAAPRPGQSRAQALGQPRALHLRVPFPDQHTHGRSGRLVRPLRHHPLRRSTPDARDPSARGAPPARAEAADCRTATPGWRS